MKKEQAMLKLSRFVARLAEALARKIGLLILLVLALRSLSFGIESAPEEESVSKLKAGVIVTYTQIAFAVYHDSLVAAEELQTRIAEFLDHPSADTLKTAREAWISARKPYLQTEVFRFCEGPIDLIESRINGWPVDENYIDYVEENPKAGIINNPERYPKLSRSLLVSLNEKEGEKNISTGFHAIEFLLWGQDRNPLGPGNRSYEDFVVGANASVANAEYRQEYLRLVTDLLVDDLRTLVKAWTAEDPNSYCAWFLASVPHKGLMKMLHGIATLGGVELAGERLTVPYETKEQEDEHSCFSDTTHLDACYDALGIQNVYYGRYLSRDGVKVEGHSLHELLSLLNPALEKELAAQIDAGVDAAQSIPPPFDKAIQGKDSAPGRLAIAKTIQALQAQAEPIAKAFVLLGVRQNEPVNQD